MNNKTYYRPQLVAIRRTTWHLSNSETPYGVIDYWKKLNPEADSCDAFEFEFARIPHSRWGWENDREQKDYVYSTIHGMEYMLSKGYIGWSSYGGHQHSYMNHRVDPDGAALVGKFTSPHEQLDLHLIVTVWPCADSL